MENYHIAGRTDVGIMRQNNEDSMIAFRCSTGQVVAVCDGMGGENGGETASNLAVSIIQDILTNNHFENPTQAISSAIIAANRGILHRSEVSPHLSGMGATCVMAIIKDNQVYYGSVGDSRIYFYNPQQGLTQVTKDQSYVQTLVDAGELTAEEAESHPRKNEITNALGIVDMTPPTVCTAPLSPTPGCFLLLCSDGLSGMVPANMMEHVLATPGISVEDKAQRLVNMANEAGGADNITVQLIEWTEEVQAKPSQPKKSGNIPGINAETSTSRKSRIPLVLCILLTVLVVIGGGVYYLTSSKPKTETIPDTTIRRADRSSSSSPAKSSSNSSSGRNGNNADSKNSKGSVPRMIQPAQGRHNSPTTEQAVRNAAAPKNNRKGKSAQRPKAEQTVEKQMRKEQSQQKEPPTQATEDNSIQR